MTFDRVERVTNRLTRRFDRVEQISDQFALDFDRCNPPLNPEKGRANRQPTR